MRILGLDVWVSVPNAEYAEFKSATSIFEFDMVFWDPANTISSYTWYEDYRGLPSLPENESVKVLSDVRRRKEEFSEYLKMGRILAIFASPPQRLYIDTGKREYSGTGRNRQTTRIVQDIDLLSALPFEYRATIAQGTAMASARPDFGAVVNKDKDRWYYRAVLNDFPGDPLMFVAGTDKAVAAISNEESGGLVVILPDITSGAEDAADEDPQRSDASDDREDPAMNAVIEWLSQLRGEDEPALPSWAVALKFPEDHARTERLVTLEENLQSVMSEIADINSEREKDDRWKQLITSTGAQLEERVLEAFQVLGFEATSDPVPGRRDLHLKFRDQFAVVEVKGVKKSASEANAAQLEKWVAEALANSEVPHKGILVVNSWRETPLQERKEPTFPHQMLGYSTARQHCLLTGLQLLSMVRAVLSGSADATSLAHDILDCVGPLPGWDDVSRLFPTEQIAEEGR